MPAILSRLSILFIIYISRDLDNTKTQAFHSVLGCQTCMWKRGINSDVITFKKLRHDQYYKTYLSAKFESL